MPVAHHDHIGAQTISSIYYGTRRCSNQNLAGAFHARKTQYLQGITDYLCGRKLLPGRGRVFSLVFIGDRLPVLPERIGGINSAENHNARTRCDGLLTSKNQSAFTGRASVDGNYI